MKHALFGGKQQAICLIVWDFFFFIKYIIFSPHITVCLSPNSVTSLKICLGVTIDCIEKWKDHWFANTNLKAKRCWFHGPWPPQFPISLKLEDSIFGCVGGSEGEQCLEGGFNARPLTCKPTYWIVATAQTLWSFFFSLKLDHIRQNGH